MKGSSKRMIGALFHERCGFLMESQRLIQSSCGDLHQAGTNEHTSLQVRVLILDALQRLSQMDASFIKCAFAPITQGEIRVCFGYLLRSPRLFKDLNALRDEILCNLLTALGLTRATEPSGQSAHAE